MKIRDEDKWYQAYIMDTYYQTEDRDARRAFDTLSEAQHWLKLMSKAFKFECHGTIVGVVWEMPKGKIVHKMKVNDS